jgi:DNA-binding transcriptional MerR regulator
MFKIGDFSKLGQVSTRMLRHYDQMGLLRPSQTDKWTGYRYYTIDQLARLHRIIALKELGFSLEQIADLLNQGDALPVTELRGMLKLRQAEISRELQEKQALHLMKLSSSHWKRKPSPLFARLCPIWRKWIITAG